MAGDLLVFVLTAAPTAVFHHMTYDPKTRQCVIFSYEDAKVRQLVPDDAVLCEIAGSIE